MNAKSAVGEVVVTNRSSGTGGATSGSLGRCDFFYRLRDTAEISDWRSQLIEKLESIVASPGPSGACSAVDLATVRLQEITRILELIYQRPGDTPPDSPDSHAERVLARLQPYHPFVREIPAGTTCEVKELVPPSFRASLWRGLTAHGQTVCRADPGCGECAIRNFCSSYRAAEAARTEASGAPTVVDLFSGAGGSSEGFIRAGFRVMLALDRDPMALRTLRFNHPGISDSRILECDIREMKAGTLRRLTRNEKVDVLIGSPPCQGFSLAGFRTRKARSGYRITGDERNYLFESMIAATAELRPRLFLLENVPGMISARSDNRSFIEHAARMLEKKCGFRTAIWRLNASAFGVPQDRIRCFLVGSATTLPSQPEAEYQDMSRRDFDLDALPPITFAEAAFDLPPRNAGAGRGTDRWDPAQSQADNRYRRYLGKFSLTGKSVIAYNHATRPNNKRDLQLYSTLQPGENSVHAVEKYGRRDLMRYRRDIFDDKYARLRADRPSKTIVAHLAKDGNGYIHPSQTRSITVREAARMQSFHDGYAFCGSVSHQWIQVGNAVPPLLAEVIARSFLKVLKNGDGHK